MKLIIRYYENMNASFIPLAIVVVKNSSIQFKAC